MLDGTLRRFIDPPLDRLSLRLVRAGISANAMTLGGFAVGLLSLPLLAVGAYGGALVAILINRLADGLDGAIARRRGASDLGGYLDIVCDFMFYGAVVFGFALAAPDNGLPAAFLLLAFIGTGGSFLAFAAMAARRKIETRSRGPKSLYYLGGLTEGTETIAFFVACCIFPGAFVPLAWTFAAACWITTITRVLSAWRMLGP
ncbi:MAG TPA: CDP-alcohol phosphatidyltransferase family protein [Dongiaceae bacterium]